MTINNPVNAKVQGLQNFNSSSGVWTGRTLTSSDSSITITNADGTAGNPNLVVNGGKIGETITGDTGGALSPTAGNWNIITNVTAINSGKTVSFSGSGSTLTLNVTDGSNNTIIGNSAGHAGISGASNTGLGNFSLNALTIGNQNSTFGKNTLLVGTSANNNTAAGYASLSGLRTGAFNTCVGVNSGSSYVGAESSNIIIGNTGTTAESHVIRIGTQGSGSGQQNTSYMAGIVGVTTSNSNFVTIDTTTGQLGAIAVPGSSIILDGDTGSATGTTLTVFTNQATLNSGSSFEFVNSGSTSTLNVTDANGNTILGNLSGTITAAANQTGDTGFGFSVLTALDPTGAGGNFSSAFGWNTLHSVTTGNGNSSFGSTALFSVTTQSNNSAFGYNVATGYNDTNLSAFGALAFNGLVSGQSNSGFGQAAFGGLTTGSFNCGFGASVGNAYSGAESSNILIMNSGVAAESNTIRIGTQGNGNGQQDLCFIAGITGVTTSNSNFVTIDTTTGQLGASASGGTLTLTGDTGTASGTSLTVFTNQASNNSGASVLFSNSGTTSTLNVTDSRNNTFIGKSCGNATLTGNSNIGLGSNILTSLTTGTNNSAVGRNNLNLCTTGGNNCAFANGCLENLVSGSGNTALGEGAGSNYTSSESNNIVIANTGTIADSAVTRIGTSGTQTTCFIAGIEGVTVSNKNYVTIDTTTGQLGSEARTIFSANLSAPQSNVTGDGTLYTVVCDNVLVNTGSAYNNTTGVFTAPVTGTYQFSATLTLLNIGALHGVAFFYVVNGSFGNVIGWNGNPFAVADSGQVTLNGSVSVHLTSGQTAAMKILVSGSTKTVQVYGVSGNETYFSGYLVG